MCSLQERGTLIGRLERVDMGPPRVLYDFYSKEAKVMSDFVASTCQQ